MLIREHRCPKRTIFYFPCILLVAFFITALIASAKAQPTEYQEAPQLSQLVETGQLPPVEERLPEVPLVVEPFEAIGQYGGTLRTELTGGIDRVQGWLSRYLGYESLVRFDPMWSEVVPNLAESWDVNEESTEFTFYLRRGAKWSDGHPFTADDIVFWYNDVLMNEQLSPAGPGGWLSVGGEPALVEKIDDYTVAFRFAVPYGLFLQQLATGWNAPLLIPSHYAKQFHAEYNPDGIDALVHQEGLVDWVNLFAQKVGITGGGGPASWANLERPSMNAWLITTPLDGRSTQVTAERNPYYFKVDPAGNQLPYIDRVVLPLISDEEVLKLQILNGDIDWVYNPQVLGIADKSLFLDNMERGGYRFVDQVSDVSVAQVIHLNLTHQDPVKREVFSSQDFRIGLSYAIDRQEIIDTIYVGQGEPYQVAPRPESPFYHERLAKQYTEYDPALANEHLDRAGYTERDAQGFRLGPDGNRISFSVQVRTINQEQIDALELIKRHWEAVGIDMQIATMESSLYQERHNANLHDAVSNVGAGGLGEMLNARLYVPINTDALYAIPWANWYTGTSPSEEPPAEVIHQLEVYDAMLATADPHQQVALMNEIFDIAADQFYHIGINLLTDRYAIAKRSLRNVPEPMPDSATYPTPGPANTSTWFFDDAGTSR
jgi:peptide/nickel transport system substrate-binding protein